jgi:hypothetical protein
MISPRLILSFCPRHPFALAARLSPPHVAPGRALRLFLIQNCSERRLKPLWNATQARSTRVPTHSTARNNWHRQYATGSCASRPFAAMQRTSLLKCRRFFRAEISVPVLRDICPRSASCLQASCVSQRRAVLRVGVARFAFRFTTSGSTPRLRKQPKYFVIAGVAI